MYPENIALRESSQGKLSFYGLEVPAAALDPDDCPVEVITINDNLDWRLRHLLRGGRVRVRNVVPCPGCERPIAILRLTTECVLRICDAVQEPDCPARWHDNKAPDGYQPPWVANIFVMHACAERTQ